MKLLATVCFGFSESKRRKLKFDYNTTKQKQKKKQKEERKETRGDGSYCCGSQIPRAKEGIFILAGSGREEDPLTEMNDTWAQHCFRFRWTCGLFSLCC